MARPLTVDQIVAGLRPQPYEYYKLNSAGKVTGMYMDLFLTLGNPAPGINPAGSVCTGTMQGALAIGANPVGKQTWLSGVSGICGNTSGYILYDRLVHYGGLSGILTSIQNLGGGIVLPRYTNAIGVIPHFTVIAGLGAVSATGTLTYTNETGAINRTTTFTIPTSAPPGLTLPIPLAAGDQGCSQMTNFQLSVSTGAVGNIGFFLAKRIARFGGVANTPFDRDFIQLGLPEIQDGACLSVLQIISATSTGNSDFSLNFTDV